MSDFGSALVGAAASLGSSGIAAASGKKNVKRTIKANKEAADLAWSRSLQAWEMENAYNTPKAQMERYAEAGLNPHLIYGTGGNSGNASSVDSPPHPTYKDDSSQGAVIGRGIENAVASFQQIRLQNAQIDNVQAQNDLIRAQTDRTEAEALSSHFNYSLDTIFKRDERQTGLWRMESDYVTANYNQDIKRIESDVVRATKSFVIDRVKQDLQNATRQGRNLDADYFYKLEATTSIRLENQLRRLGINPNDPTYLRVLGRALNKSLDTPELKDFLNRKSNSMFYGR